MSYIYKNEPKKPPSPPRIGCFKGEEKYKANVKFEKIIKDLYPSNLRQKDIVQLMHSRYGWSASESAFCDKMRRGLKLCEAEQLLNVLGYEFIIKKQKKF